MTAAGYVVSTHSFNFLYNADATPPIFQQTAPVQASYVDGPDFASMTFSPNGDHTAAVTAVDIRLPQPGDPPTGVSTSGCEDSDFVGFPAGTIALTQRGTCTFADKALNADEAGAVAVIVMNEGQPGRTAAVAGTLGGAVAHNSPVIGTTFAIGDDLRNGVLNGPTGSTARVSVNRVFENRTTENVIAETPGRRPEPGGRGGCPPRQRSPRTGSQRQRLRLGRDPRDRRDVRGTGPRGAQQAALHVVRRRGVRSARLTGLRRQPQPGPAQSDRADAELRHGRLAELRPIRVRRRQLGLPARSGRGRWPTGIGEIERVFADYFASQGLASAETAFSGRSDYGPFIVPAVNIPAGGLFTGAEGVKTAAEAAIYGGSVGDQYDPCYHLACDTFAGTGTSYALSGLDQMSDAAAHAVLLFSKRNFAKQPLTTTSADADVSLQALTSGATSSGPHPASDDHEAVDR